MLHLYRFRTLILVSLFTIGSISGCAGGGGGDAGTGAETGTGAGTGTGTGAGAGTGAGTETGTGTGTGTDNVDTLPADTLPANDSPAGIWIGTVTSIQTGEKTNSIGLVTETGVLRFINDTSVQIAGDVTVTANTFTGEITAYAPYGFFTFSKGEPAVTGTVSGTINEKSTFNGSTTLDGSVNSSFEFNYDAEIYEKNSGLSLISGNYSASDGAGYTVTYSINAAGVITGSDTDGCQMNGDVELLNPDFNMYRLVVRVANCGDLNGNYRGPASLFDVDTPYDTLVFSLECVRFLMAGSIPRA
jgi:hypothetical protein